MLTKTGVQGSVLLFRRARDNIAAMWKKHPVKYKPLLALLLLILLLMSFIGWQWLQVTELGQRWRQLPQRTLAAPLADYAELQAINSLVTDDAERQRRLVEELVSAKLVVAAQLYDGGGQLLAEAGLLGDGELPYIRPLYQEERPVGFLRMQLAPSPLTMAQRGIWQQLLHHVSWLLPLCALLGILVGLGLRRRRQDQQQRQLPAPDTQAPQEQSDAAQ
ncbi:putative membrane protein affecting hemolysin expression [Oceanisphaera litoralis]|uniref:hypothetical protein n=1 Tax=Oceanisphaera litoralis TaxID=225144 RepID=UPI00195C8BB2|nr:hypothetical protein [Oceanisphaera litoralis]MBM7455733.1 putative membrane protein affecting hemolysin expression [Oceanisphaera litoralis]